MAVLLNESMLELQLQNKYMMMTEYKNTLIFMCSHELR